MIVCPRVTWPSPAITTLPRWRTHRIVVERILARDELGSGVGTAINLFQMADTDMGIALSGGQARMAEHFLYRSQVCPRVQHVGCKTMAKSMRANGGSNTGLHETARDNFLY